jgi:hypothetical protein
MHVKVGTRKIPTEVNTGRAADGARNPAIIGGASMSGAPGGTARAAVTASPFGARVMGARKVAGATTTLRNMGRKFEGGY